jgi:hypothetical protein
MTRPSNSKNPWSAHALLPRVDDVGPTAALAALQGFCEFLGRDAKAAADADKVRTKAARRAAPKRRKPSRATVIRRIEKQTGKTVTGIALAADGSVSSVTFGELSQAPSTGLTADDELARWRRKHAR